MRIFPRSGVVPPEVAALEQGSWVGGQLPVSFSLVFLLFPVLFFVPYERINYPYSQMHYWDLYLPPPLGGNSSCLLALLLRMSKSVLRHWY